MVEVNATATVLKEEKQGIDCYQEECCSEDPILDQFSDEVPEDEEEITQEQAQQSAGILRRFSNYIQSKAFVHDCNAKAKQLRVSPKKVAKTYIGKVAGLIGDSLGVVIDTAEIGASGLVHLIGTVLNSVVSIICSVARGIVAFFTGNRTTVGAQA